MAQIKKDAVRNAILASANDLFTEKDYSSTTLAEIARRANVTVSNIYNYFGSKLELLFEIYEPWMMDRLSILERDADKIPDRRARFRFVILTLFHHIPSENNNFANNVLQAISTRKTGETYSRKLLLTSEARVSSLLQSLLPTDTKRIVDCDLLAHLLFMAFDGFSVNYRLVGPSKQAESIADMICDLVFGSSTNAIENE